MRLIGVLGRSETPASDMVTDGLATFNAMLDEWHTNNLTVYRIGSQSFTWASGQTSRTIGPTGDLVGTRPNEIDHAFQRENSVDHPIGTLSAQEYSAIADKTTTSTLIQWLYYDPTYPNGTLYAYPVPSVAASIQIKALEPLQSFTASIDELALPPGYENAIVYNGAIELAGEYQRPVPNYVQSRATSSLRNVRRQNSRPVLMRSDFHSQTPFNIQRGY